MSSGIFNRINGCHNRRSIRLNGYDYSRPGYYFITICIHNPTKRLFGDVVKGTMILNDAGKMVQRCWLEIPEHYRHVELDEFQVMPNHLHGIIVINEHVDSTAGGIQNGVQNIDGVQNIEPLPKCQNRYPRILNRNRYQHIIPGSIGSIMRGFKIGVTKWFRAADPEFDVWQRNLYDHIIRDEKSLRRIRKYIRDNPEKWAVDHDNHLGGEIDDIEKW
jgi:putative transposase